MYVFVDLGRINLDVDDFGLLGIFTQVARNPVVKAHADGNQHITFVLLDVGTVVAMHAQHTHVQGVFVGDGRQTVDGTSQGNPGFFYKSFEFLLTMSNLNAVTCQNHWLFGIVDQLCGIAQGFNIRL